MHFFTAAGVTDLEELVVGVDFTACKDWVEVVGGFAFADDEVEDIVSLAGNLFIIENKVFCFFFKGSVTTSSFLSHVLQSAIFLASSS